VKRATRIFQLGLVVALLSLGLGVTLRATAQEKSYRIERWETHMEVQPDGDVEVRETQTVRFIGSFSYYGRTIPHRRLDDISDVTVYDETEGRELTNADVDLTRTISEGFPATDILINFAVTDDVKTWTIGYTVEGGIGFFEDHDELYWNVIPSDRDVPIGAIKTTVTLPSAVDFSNVKTTLYDDNIPASNVEVVDQSIIFSAGPAKPFTDFTIVVGWLPGAVQNPGIVRVESSPSGAAVFVDGFETVGTTPYAVRRGTEITDDREHEITVKKWFLESEPQRVTIAPGELKVIHLKVLDTIPKIILFAVVVAAILGYALLPVIVAVFLFFIWRKTGRDPKGRGTIIAEFDPPDGTEPAVVGTLVDERVDLKDITATIIDLAVRGYVLIEELPKKTFQQQDYKLVLKKSFQGDVSLKEFEKKLLEGIFGSSTEKKMSEMKNKFYSRIPEIQKALYESVVQHGYFAESPDKRRKKYGTWATIVIFVGFFGVFYAGLTIPILLAGIVIAIFAKAAPQRTKSGVLATEHAQGFKLYLNTAERYVVKKMTPETFERFLPYAMVFNIEQKWAEKFKDIYVNREPSWYHSTTGAHFNAILLTRSLSTWSTAATGTLTSRPGSSGSGGFSSGSSGFSGGFSGGGGGGGGVRAG
jgi:uncharacterized membrane protein